MNRRSFIIVLYIICIALFSCDEDDTARGYYSVDGKKYSLEYASIHPDGYNSGPYETEVVLTGEYGYQVWIIFITNTQQVKSGSYSFPVGINYCDVLIGPNGSNYISSNESEGTFVVNVKSDTYTFDLDVVIDSHEIKAHYKGDVHIFSPS